MQMVLKFTKITRVQLAVDTGSLNELMITFLFHYANNVCKKNPNFLTGKVLVNCLMGMSRSSTCVLAYLMLRQNMTAVEALTEVRRHREVRPNDGFLRQLADLDNKLRRERGQLKSSWNRKKPEKNGINGKLNCSKYRKSSIRSRLCIILDPDFPRLVFEAVQKLWILH